MRHAGAVSGDFHYWPDGPSAAERVAVDTLAVDPLHDPARIDTLAEADAAPTPTIPRSAP